MNKTLSIGLAGFSFVIEEHAYIKLSDYLAALRNSLDAAEADEVMHDIEIRMVEIFKDSLGKREVINADDVDRVIAQIGKPEQIEEQEEAYFSEKTANTNRNSGTYRGQKQLFRDPEKQKIAGVCAGLAHYTGMDMTLMRAIWVIVFLVMIPAAGSALLVVLLYIILWAILPKAQTASDFLKMKGQPVNFDTLKAESNKIVQFANESTQRVGEIYNENKPYINQAGNGLWNAFRYIVGGFLAFLSIMCIVALFGIFGLIGNEHFGGLNEIDFLFDGEMSWVFRLLISLSILVPALLFGVLAIKLLSPKTQIRNLGYVVGALFILLASLGIYFGMSMAKKEMFYKGHKEDTEKLMINTTSDSLLLDVKNIVIPQNYTAYDNDLFSDKKNVFHADYPFIEVKRRPDVTVPYLNIQKDAEGYNIPLDLKVPVEIQGNKVIFPNFIQYPYAHRFRDYNVNYELVVPQNTKVITLRENKLSVRDGDENSSDEDDTDANVSVTSSTGQSVIISSSNKDSVIVNGKKYPKDVAEKMLDSMKVDFDNLKDVNISIRNGKKEISIKTDK